MIVSVGGSLAAFLMSAPRVYYAMAGDGVFPTALARIDPRRGTPVRAILGQSAAGDPAFSPPARFETIVAYFVFITVVFLIAAVAGIYRIRRRDAPAPVFRVPGYPWTPLGFIVPGCRWSWRSWPPGTRYSRSPARRPLRRDCSCGRGSRPTQRRSIRLAEGLIR